MSLLRTVIAKKVIGDDTPGPTPTGTIPITENGTYDVAEFAEAEVEVASEDNLVKLMNGNPVSFNDDSITRLSLNVANLRSIRVPNATSIAPNFSRLIRGITDVFAPEAVVGTEAFKGCTTLQWIVCKGPVNTLAGERPLQAYIANTMALEKVDFTDPVGIGAQTFEGDYKLALLILRKTTVCPLTNINAFDGTEFGSEGSGGTIYIPKALYDHLGDGTAMDYRAATNWSYVDGYGNIIWRQIEGSQYENAYIDGTPIE